MKHEAASGYLIILPGPKYETNMRQAKNFKVKLLK